MSYFFFTYTYSDCISLEIKFSKTTEDMKMKTDKIKLNIKSSIVITEIYSKLTFVYNDMDCIKFIQKFIKKRT